MSLNVQIKITGDKETIAKLGKMGQSLLNFQTAMRSIGKELPSYFSNQVFGSQGGAIGERWPALKQATKDSKAKKYFTATPLVNTGAMKRGFRAEYPDFNSVMIGNVAPYFDYHQSKAPRSKLPRRTMMSTGGQVKSIIGSIIDADVKQKITKAGL